MSGTAGRVALQEGLHCVLFPVPGYHADYCIAFGTSHEANGALDILRLKAACEEQGSELALLPLSKPLECYADLLEELFTTPWDQVLLSLKKAGGAGCTAEFDDGGHSNGAGTVQAGAAPAAAAQEDGKQAAQQHLTRSDGRHQQARSQNQSEQLEQPPRPLQQQPDQEQQPEPEQEQEQEQDGPHTCSGSGSGSDVTPKRRRRSEVERLELFSWDPQRNVYPFNANQIQPNSTKRTHKRKWGLLDGKGSTPATTTSTLGAAERGALATADTACSPDMPTTADTAQAAAGASLGPGAGAADYAAAVGCATVAVEVASMPAEAAGVAKAAPAAAAAERLELSSPAAEQREGTAAAALLPAMQPQLQQEPVCRQEQGQGPLQEAPMPHTEPQQGAVQKEEEPPPQEQQEQQEQQHPERRLESHPANHAARARADGAAQPTAAAEPQPGRPLPAWLNGDCTSLVALGFLAAWSALRQGAAVREAQARDAELRALLGPVAQLGARAADAAQRYTCCFCTVLLPHQQAQHLARLRGEAAGRGTPGVAEWVLRTLRTLALPDA